MELKLAGVRAGSDGADLLIVPYGIETLVSQKQYQLKRSFNRTLWN